MIRSTVKIIIIIFLIQECFFYSIRGSLPAHINSISLAPVVNESAEFAVAEILNDELNELMVNENVLDIVMPEQADSRLEVVIISVTDNPIQFPSHQTMGWKRWKNGSLLLKLL